MARRALTRSQQLAQSYILGYQTAKAEITSALKALEDVFGIRDGIAASIEAFNLKGAHKDKMAQAVAMTDESIEKIKGTASFVGDRYALISDFLDEIEKKDHIAGLALRFYYIDGKSYDEIAKELHLSSSSVYRVLNQGLDEGFELLAEDPERWM